MKMHFISVILLLVCLRGALSIATYTGYSSTLKSSQISETETTESGQNVQQEYDEADSLSIATSSPMSNTSHINPDCWAFVKEFGLRSSRFIRCSVENARPFRFCEGCVVHYQRAKTVFQDIVDNDETLDNCRKELLNSDRVQVINSVQKDIIKIWETADCKKCFSHISEDKNGTVHYTRTDETKRFVQLYKNFTHCIHKNETGSYNATVCDVCNHFYSEMNNMFDQLLNDPISPQHVCMDIVDMMNYTRLAWGQDLKCTRVHKQYPAVLTVAIGLLFIPVIFYGSLKVYATKRTRNFLKQKRLSIFQHTTTYGSLDSPGLTTEDHPSDSESHDSANQSAASNVSGESADGHSPPSEKYRTEQHTFS